MVETCHECGEPLGVNARVMGVFGARKPSYGAPATLWAELYDGQIIFVYHPECLQKLWESKIGENLPEATTHSRTLS